MRPGGPPFFRRGVLRGRESAFKKRRRVCVFEGAPRVHAGARGPKIIDFSLISITPRQRGGKTMHLGPSCDGLSSLCRLTLSFSTKNEIAL